MTVSKLVECLDSNDTAVRIQAAERLAGLGPDAAPAACGLVRNVGDVNESLAEWSCAALETLGPPPRAMLDDLLTLAGSPNPDVAYWAVTLIGRLEIEARPAVRTLARLVRSTDHDAVRQRATWALGRIGPSAESARPVLETAAADDDDPRLAGLARIALDRIAG